MRRILPGLVNRAEAEQLDRYVHALSDAILSGDPEAARHALAAASTVYEGYAGRGPQGGSNDSADLAAVGLALDQAGLLLSEDPR